MGVVPIVNENDTVSVSVSGKSPQPMGAAQHLSHPRKSNLETTTHYLRSPRTSSTPTTSSF